MPVSCVQAAPTANELTTQPPANNACLTGTRFIRVNVHFVQDGAGGKNFGPVDLPPPANERDMDDNGYRWAQGLMDGANSTWCWGGNPPMKLPVGNTTPANPKRVQLVLTGVYFDKVSDDQKRQWSLANHADSYLFDTFGKDKLNTINIFVMNNLDASYNNTGGNASAYGPTPAQGCWVKIMAPWQANKRAAATPSGTVHGPWAYTGILNHELGHIFSLFHSWSGDDCPDTPDNPNCWDDSSPNCAGATPPQPASNNMMDYNNVQNALTPCQITKMHNTIGSAQPAIVDACGTCAPTHAAFNLRAGTTPVMGAYTVSAVPLIINGSASVNESTFDLTIYRVAGLGCTASTGGYFQQSFNQPFDSYTLSGATFGGGDINLSSLYAFQTSKIYRMRLRT